MIPGIGTLINSFAVIGVGLLSRFFVKKEIKNFENINTWGVFFFHLWRNVGLNQ